MTGINNLFKELLEKCSFERLFDCVQYLIKEKTVNITNKQFTILKGCFEKFKNQPKLNLEKYVIIFQSEYIPSIYSNNKESDNLILSIIKEYLTIDTIKESIEFNQNYSNYQIIEIIIKTNLKLINLELSNKINLFILNYLNGNQININPTFIYLLNSLILLKSCGSSNDNDNYKEEESIIKLYQQIIESIKNEEIENSDIIDITIRQDYSISFENCCYLISLLKKHNLQFIDILYFTYGKDHYFQTKYYTEFIEFANEKYTDHSSLINSLLSNKQFTHQFINQFLKSIEEKETSKFLHGSINDFKIEYQLIYQLFSEFKVKFNFHKSYISRSLQYYINSNQYYLEHKNNNNQSNQLHLDCSIFKINEMEIPLNERKELSQLYGSTLDCLIESNKYIDSKLPILFHSINSKTSPERFKFFQTNIHFFLSILNINNINRYLLPLYPDECLNSNIYKLKQDNEIIIDTITTTIQLPFYLIKDIIIISIKDKKNEQFNKLQISLVSKKFFEICQDVMNLNLDSPISIYDNLDFNSMTGSNWYSLILPSCKYLKVKSTNMLWADSDYLDTEFTNLYDLNIIGGFSNLNFTNLFNNYLDSTSIEILDIQGEPNQSQLQFLIDSSNFKKLILHSTNEFILKSLFQLKQLPLVELYIYLNYIEDIQSFSNPSIITTTTPFDQYHHDEDYSYSIPSLGKFITNTSSSTIKIKCTTVSIGMFFHSDFISNCLPFVGEHLIIQVEQWNKRNEPFEHIPLNHFLQKLKYLELQVDPLLETLEFQFNTETYSLKKLFKIFKGIKHIKSIVIVLNYDFQFHSFQILNQIFNLLSSSKQYSSIVNLTIKSNSNYTIYENWDDNEINLKSFKPIEPFNFINFIRDNSLFSEIGSDGEGDYDEEEDDDEGEDVKEEDYSFSFDSDYEEEGQNNGNGYEQFGNEIDDETNF